MNINESQIICDDKKILDNMAIAYKEKLIVEINNLIIKYDISLTEEELKIIN